MDTKERYLKALRDREFVPYIQNITDGNKVVGGEVLARWKDPERGIVGPGEFVGDMIKANLIIDLDLYMFEEACRKQQSLNESGKGMMLTCNFTRASISDPCFAEKVSDILSKYDFNHSLMVIEITEDCIESNKDGCYF